MAVETGTTSGAARIRYVRLKEKIEVIMNSGSSGTPGKANTTQTPQPPTTKKTATPRKRKARVLEDDNDVDEEGEEGDAQAPPQVDGSNEAQPVATPRQTRGKKLSYDFSAILDSDNDSSLVSFDEMTRTTYWAQVVSSSKTNT